VNPRTEEVEGVADIEAKVEEALRYFPPEAIFLNPDCGFGTFANRPLNTADIAERKLAAIVAVAERLRGRIRPAPADGNGHQAAGKERQS
jgi:5-methyltetrahydropteroyltriglutamate--homocysteine methyltransferase